MKDLFSLNLLRVDINIVINGYYIMFMLKHLFHFRSLYAIDNLILWPWDIYNYNYAHKLHDKNLHSLFSKTSQTIMM